MEILNNIKKNTIILIVMTIIILYIVLKDDFMQIVKDIKMLDYKYLLIALLLYFIYLFLHSYIVYKTVNQKEKFSLKESVKHNVIAQFFNGITPFSTGGQPMEIYMLTEHDISVSKSTNYIIENFIFYQIALVLFGFVAVIINTFLGLFTQTNIIKEFVLLGFIVNTLVAVVLLFISTSESFAKKTISLFINILYKLHIVKDKKKQEKIWYDRAIEFHECAKELKERKSLFFIGVLFNFIGLACLYSIPLLIVYALHDFNSLNLISAITSSAYVMVVSSFIPIPGASGGIEYSFTQFYGNFLSSSKTATLLIIWRFLTYYLGMIIGAIAFSFDKPKEVEK